MSEYDEEIEAETKRMEHEADEWARVRDLAYGYSASDIKFGKWMADLKLTKELVAKWEEDTS